MMGKLKFVEYHYAAKTHNTHTLSETVGETQTYLNQYLLGLIDKFCAIEVT